MLIIHSFTTGVFFTKTSDSTLVLFPSSFHFLTTLFYIIFSGGVVDVGGAWMEKIAMTLCAVTLLALLK